MTETLKRSQKPIEHAGPKHEVAGTVIAFKRTQENQAILLEDHVSRTWVPMRREDYAALVALLGPTPLDGQQMVHVKMAGEDDHGRPANVADEVTVLTIGALASDLPEGDGED